MERQRHVCVSLSTQFPFPLYANGENMKHRHRQCSTTTQTDLRCNYLDGRKTTLFHVCSQQKK